MRIYYDPKSFNPEEEFRVVGTLTSQMLEGLDPDRLAMISRLNELARDQPYANVNKFAYAASCLGNVDGSPVGALYIHKQDGSLELCTRLDGENPTGLRVTLL